MRSNQREASAPDECMYSQKYASSYAYQCACRIATSHVSADCRCSTVQLHQSRILGLIHPLWQVQEWAARQKLDSLAGGSGGSFGRFRSLQEWHLAVQQRNSRAAPHTSLLQQLLEALSEHVAPHPALLATSQSCQFCCRCMPSALEHGSLHRREAGVMHAGAIPCCLHHALGHPQMISSYMWPRSILH